MTWGTLNWCVLMLLTFVCLIVGKGTEGIILSTGAIIIHTICYKDVKVFKT